MKTEQAKRPELETVNRLYLELSQVVTATTARELELHAALKEANDLCRSVRSIADRKGAETNWEAFTPQLDNILVKHHLLLQKKLPHEHGSEVNQQTQYDPLSFRGRVIAEKAELEVKLEKLRKFVGSINQFNALPVSEQDRLKRQAVAMHAYSEVLSERIAKF